LLKSQFLQSDQNYSGTGFIINSTINKSKKLGHRYTRS
jgi:hypothetical protein